MTSLNFPCYVINLPFDQKRKEVVTQEMAKHGIDPVFIEGVVGKNLTFRDYVENTTIIYSLFGVPGVVGCAMSHLKVWKQALEEGYEQIMVCEDDVVFAEDFKDKLNSVLTEIPADNDLVYVGCLHSEKDKPTNTVLTILQFLIRGVGRTSQIPVSEHVYVPQIAFGTHCYIASRKGLEKLVQAFDKNIKYHVDFHLQTLPDLVKYALHPKLAFQESAAQSTISSAKFPWFINSRLEKKIDNSGINYCYHYTVPSYQIFGEHVNTWCAIFLGFGLIAALLGIPFLILLLLYGIFFMREIVHCGMSIKRFKTALFYEAFFLLPTGNFYCLSYHLIL
jgi:GR25 family glycosyltransferase involved in LPS biosynthesis